MILVTGSAGFIGSHLVERLVRDGRDVRAFVFYNSSNRWGWLDTFDRKMRDAIDVFAGDIRDYQSVRTAMSGCEAVVHLAALISIPYSYASPDAFVETNVRGTLNVLQAARDLAVSRVVHTSTSEVYGTAQSIPMSEHHPLCAQSPYAASKSGADQLAFSFHRSFGTPVVMVRPFNTYGPRQSARAVIPSVISQLADGRGQVKVGAVHPRRDFSFVEDTVRGILAALEAPQALGEVVNLGSGYEISIGELVELIAEVMGTDANLEVDPQRLRPQDSEVDRLWADNTKARSLLVWEPKYGGREGLRAGLEQTVMWFRDSENLRHYKANLYNV